MVGVITTNPNTGSYAYWGATKPKCALVHTRENGDVCSRENNDRRYISMTKPEYTKYHYCPHSYNSNFYDNDKVLDSISGILIPICSNYDQFVAVKSLQMPPALDK